MKPITDFGLAVKSELLKANQTQKWLIGECRKLTGMYVDTSVLNKIMTGERHSKRLVAAICTILHLNPPSSTDTKRK